MSEVRTRMTTDVGRPVGGHMNGYSSHTFSLINGRNQLFHVKWHF
jgi:catalase